MMTCKTKIFDGVVYTYKCKFSCSNSAELIRTGLLADGRYFDSKVTGPDSLGYHIVWVRKSIPKGFEMIDAVKKFKATGPWTGTLEERRTKFKNLHSMLSHILGLKASLDLNYTTIDEARSRRFLIRDKDGHITTMLMAGKLSVVTYLNGIGILTGHDYFSQWGLKLFEEVFPEDYAQVYGDLPVGDEDEDKNEDEGEG